MSAETGSGWQVEEVRGGFWIKYGVVSTKSRFVVTERGAALAIADYLTQQERIITELREALREYEKLDLLNALRQHPGFDRFYMASQRLQMALIKYETWHERVAEALGRPVRGQLEQP